MVRAPSYVPTEATPASVFTGDTHTCLTTHDGELHCFGDNTVVQFGRMPDGGSDVPVPAEIPHRFVLTFLSRGMTCRIADSMLIWCWGSDSTGLLVSTDATDPCGVPGQRCRHSPLEVFPGNRFRTLSLDRAACAISDLDEPYCWGANNHGQLGIGRPDVESTHIPQRVLDPL